MKWQKLTKDVFPDITKKEYLVSDETYTYGTREERIIIWKSKNIYIIAMNIDHMPDVEYAWRKTKLDNKHFFRTFQAEHKIVINTKTGEITREEKQFVDRDTDDFARISINDKNLEYCRYKMMELEDITD